jgi:enamine deaminase RidA (YjgF/YER057c/UK114 family)
MSRHLISTGSPFEKTAGYSRAVVDGDFAFVSGTTGYDYASMTMPADVTSQTRNCFKTIEGALKMAASRSPMSSVRSITSPTLRMRTRCSRSAEKSLAISGRRQPFSSSRDSTSPK